ncbi:MAG: ClpXP protease specificity-enhancing factor SspB [Pseudomonadota bacterium]
MSENEQPEDLIRYDVLTQEALREVIRKVLEEISIAGLPGEHHFFITFKTDHPGVRLSARMRERYPEEMTIVIQHSFWDLNVSETNFEIDLSFDDILERLRIPFASLKGFFDPYVKFGVQFDAEYLEAANADIDITKMEQEAENVDNLPQVAQTRELAQMSKETAPDTADSDNQDKKAQPEEGAEIVSLDKFRKKQ